MNLGKQLYLSEETILFGLSPTIDFREAPYFTLRSFHFLAKHNAARMPVNLVEQRLRVLLLLELLSIRDPIQINSFGILSRR